MKKFKRIYIETTNVCNLDCSFCPKTKREKKFMSSSEFEEILTKIKIHTDYIYLHLMGEPLLNTKVEEFLLIADKNNIKVNITTNGTLLSKNKNKIIKSNSVRQINISLHSFEANEESFTFEEYFEEILKVILEINKKTNIIIAIRLWNLNGDKTIGKNKLNNQILTLMKRYFNIEDIYLDGKNKIKDRIYLNLAEKFDWPDENISTILEKGFCYGLRDHLGILVDGTVVPCCLDSEGSIKLGNIFSSSLEDILNSNRAKNIYNGFSRRERVEELCKRCGYSTRF